MQDLKKTYDRLKATLLADKAVCEANKEVIGEFLEWQERKLARINGIAKLDNPTYKTLLGYLQRIRNLNKWVDNKPFKELTEGDIRNLYDGLETGQITTRKGTRVQDRRSYYEKLLKSKFGEFCGIRETCRKVMEFSKPIDNKTVRFLTEKDVRKMVEVLTLPKQKLLIWLLWDYGENIGAMLELKKSDFYRSVDDETKRVIYRLNFRREILKRSRMPRSELNNYEETAQLLDARLSKLQDDQRLFDFGYRQTVKFFKRAVKLTGIKAQPKGDSPKIKDLRSGMCCDLLSKGWTITELNSRLGHRPSSDEIDKYANFLALDRRKPRQKVYEHNLAKVESELREIKQREQLIMKRLTNTEALLTRILENPEFQKEATKLLLS